METSTQELVEQKIKGLLAKQLIELRKYASLDAINRTIKNYQSQIDEINKKEVIYTSLYKETSITKEGFKREA